MTTIRDNLRIKLIERMCWDEVPLERSREIADALADRMGYRDTKAEKEGSCPPFVLVEVKGGVAYVTHAPRNFPVVVLDYDNEDSGEPTTAVILNGENV